MRKLTIDPSRLKVIHDAVAREKAAHGACAARLNDAIATEAELTRQIQGGRRVATARKASEASGWPARVQSNGPTLQASLLETDRTSARAAILDASSELEDAKDRLAAATRLRSACEVFVHGR